MKKILGKIGSFFGTVIGIAVALLFGIFLIVLIPFDYIKYKRSLYYKRERKKYTLYVACGTAFDLYNEILKNDLPIKYISNPKDEGLAYGWFVYDKTLLILDCVAEYDPQEKKWGCGEYGDNSREVAFAPLEDFLKQEVDEMNELLGSIVCDKAVVLMDADCFDDVEQAKNEKCFLIYDGNREEVLKNFCK